MGGVADADVDAVLGRTVESPLLQPDRQPGAAARGVDDEVGGASPRPLSSRTPVTRRLVVSKVGSATAACTMLDVGDRLRSAPDLPLEMRPARHVRRELVAQLVRRAEHVARGAEVDAVRPVLQDRDARGDHVVEQPRKLRVEFLGAASHQQMHVPALRHRGAVGRLRGQLVAFVHRDPVVEVRQHARGAHAGDARPDDDRVFPSPPHWGDGTGPAESRRTRRQGVIYWSPDRGPVRTALPLDARPASSAGCAAWCGRRSPGPGPSRGCPAG